MLQLEARHPLSQGLNFRLWTFCVFIWIRCFESRNKFLIIFSVALDSRLAAAFNLTSGQIVLARRTRSLFLDAEAAMEAAPAVARFIAQETGKDDEWISLSLDSFNRIAECGYTPFATEIGPVVFVITQHVQCEGESLQVALVDE